MKPNIPEVRNLIEQTRENLERLVRICDHCVPIVRNGLVSTLEQQNYTNLRRIFYSLKNLSKTKRYADIIEGLKTEVDRLENDYNFVRAQYSLN